MNVTQLPCYIHDYSILIEKKIGVKSQLSLIWCVFRRTLIIFDTIVKYEKNLDDIFANWQLFSSRCFS